MATSDPNARAYVLAIARGPIATGGWAPIEPYRNKRGGIIDTISPRTRRAVKQLENEGLIQVRTVHYSYWGNSWETGQVDTVVQVRMR